MHYIPFILSFVTLPHFIYIAEHGKSAKNKGREREFMSFKLFQRTTRFDKLIMQECVKKRSIRFLQVECAFVAKYDHNRSVASHRTAPGNPSI